MSAKSTKKEVFLNLIDFLWKITSTTMMKIAFSFHKCP